MSVPEPRHAGTAAEVCWNRWCTVAAGRAAQNRRRDLPAGAPLRPVPEARTTADAPTRRRPRGLSALRGR